MPSEINVSGGGGFKSGVITFGSVPTNSSGTLIDVTAGLNKQVRLDRFSTDGLASDKIPNVSIEVDGVVIIDNQYLGYAVSPHLSGFTFAVSQNGVACISDVIGKNIKVTMSSGSTGNQVVQYTVSESI